MKKFIKCLESVTNVISFLYLSICILILILLVLLLCIEEFTGNIGFMDSVHDLMK
jgi:hypothetical protein